ncbi:Acetyltransferase (GNAT) domain-containing protein [Chitinophaga terrae (ex Kim and Jung 2007)]|uniref:Acetyltransferase (GNAT) domain-containing protein n=1 Tax=Chitinophaga terrae (ex Kim and Jung 2007) TaxID=408074 RepID=A0A1H3XWX0_9BACT|nr:peptidoglycan bridge formation glycyltransferase FemA/FemB family protein [Chitinophaga terrae (ex Kim and Jung 2007)]SEA03740.1 Acetyltransferase (GNAT) domain-containing protein [Chitinophaga terrae (ex Kim and Jung 2007)]
MFGYTFKYMQLWQIFNSESALTYEALLKRFHLQLDIYYQPSFLAADAFMHGGTYEIFVCYDQSSIFIYPYIKKEFENNYYDITSPYGYCGPYSNNAAFFDIGEKAFLDYVVTQGKMVSEFIRYHPIYNVGNGMKFKQNISNIKNRTVVMLNTSCEWQEIWDHSFSNTNRNLVRKMKKEGLFCEIVDYNSYIHQFIEMYYQTMRNANAKEYYYFKDDYLNKLKHQLGDNLLLAVVRDAQHLYAAGLFFLSGNILTYFLSARNLLFTKVPATNLLLTSMSEWANMRGVSYINFGGGLTDSENDSLFQFKSNFSKVRYPFYIGKRIHKPDIYEMLKEKWISENGSVKYEELKNTLQFYHK